MVALQKLTTPRLPFFSFSLKKKTAQSLEKTGESFAVSFDTRQARAVTKFDCPSAFRATKRPANSKNYWAFIRHGEAGKQKEWGEINENGAGNRATGGGAALRKVHTSETISFELARNEEVGKLLDDLEYKVDDSPAGRRDITAEMMPTILEELAKSGRRGGYKPFFSVL